VTTQLRERTLNEQSKPTAGRRSQPTGGLGRAPQALDTFPALAESRDRLLKASSSNIATANMVAAIESDIALAIAVMRAANSRQRGNRRMETVREAVELLGREAVRALAGRVRTFDFFEHTGIWDMLPGRMRLHALATQRAADRIAAEVGYASRDRLAVTSLLHDVGKLVLVHASPLYIPYVPAGAMRPHERVAEERRQFGIDHAALGGALLQRWGLPRALALAVAHHHDPDAQQEAGIIRLADLLAHYERGTYSCSAEMAGSAHAIDLTAEQLRRLLYELPKGSGQRRIPVEPCPLSSQELRILQLLAKGLVYKEIARMLGLSPSTIRSHLHNIYGKFDGANRARVVLIATERGWL
jgi:HD-like signal output (HDOD) protein/DNA-binding CsgD family transcriptional regulator